MKKILLILVGILTFSIGFGFFRYSLPEKFEKLNTLSLCTILETPADYQHKRLKIKALLVNGGYYDVVSSTKVMDFSNECASDNTVKLFEESFESRNYQEISEDMWEVRQPMQDGWAIAEVELIGKLKKVGNYKGVKKRYIFLAEEIKLVKPARFYLEKEVDFLNQNLNK